MVLLCGCRKLELGFITKNAIELPSLRNHGGVDNATYSDRNEQGRETLGLGGTHIRLDSVLELANL